MRESYSTQVFRVDGKNSFMEVLNTAFPIGKVQFNFVEYDPNQNNKQTKNLAIYMDTLTAVALAERILNGEFERMIEKAKATGKFNGTNVSSYTSFFTDMGGISEANANDYLAIPEVAAVGGTWLGKPSDIVEEKWDAIREKVRQAVFNSRK